MASPKDISSKVLEASGSVSRSSTTTKLYIVAAIGNASGGTVTITGTQNLAVPANGCLSLSSPIECTAISTDANTQVIYYES